MKKLLGYWLKTRYVLMVPKAQHDGSHHHHLLPKLRLIFGASGAAAVALRPKARHSCNCSLRIHNPKIMKDLANDGNINNDSVGFDAKIAKTRNPLNPKL